MAAAVRVGVQRRVMLPQGEWITLVQIFADDISAAVAHVRRMQTIQSAEGLSGPLMRELGIL